MCCLKERRCQAGVLVCVLHTSSVIICMCVFVCVSLSALCVCWLNEVCVVHAEVETPDEDAFQSDHTPQMLRSVWGNHTQRHWRLKGIHHHRTQSKLFSTHDETNHHWKNTVAHGKIMLHGLFFFFFFGEWVNVSPRNVVEM